MSECKYDVPQKDAEELCIIIFIINIDLEEKIQKIMMNNVKKLLKKLEDGGRVCVCSLLIEKKKSI